MKLGTERVARQQDDLADLTGTSFEVGGRDANAGHAIGAGPNGCNHGVRAPRLGTDASAAAEEHPEAS